MEKNFFWIYILHCSNNSFYTGYAVNLTRRYWQHLNGKRNAKYTGAFRPTGIACCWVLRDTKGTALRIEHLVRTQKRRDKERLVYDPESLKVLARNHLGRDIDIQFFEPLRIENEIHLHEKCPGFDPFNT